MSKPDLDQPKADQAYVSRIEAGKINLTIEMVAALAEALRVEPADLLRPSADVAARKR